MNIRSIGALIAGVVAVAVASLTFAPVFSGWSWLIPTVFGAIVASLVVSLLVDRQVPVSVIWLAGLAAMVAWLLVAVLASEIANDPLGGQPWRALLDGIFRGWNRALGDELPITNSPRPLVFLTALAWVASMINTLTIMKRRSGLAVLLTATVIIALGSAISLPSGPRAALLGALAAAAALTAVALAARSLDEDASRSRVLLGGVVLSVGSLLAIGGGQLISASSDAFDPRSLREEAVTEVDVPDPLAEMNLRIDDAADTETDPLISVSVNSGPPPNRLRLAVYDTYDGERWLINSSLVQLEQFPDPEELPPGEAVSITVERRNDADRWLPLPDRVTSIIPGRLRYDEAHQIALTGRASRFTARGSVLDAVLNQGETINRDVDSAMIAIPPETPPELLAVATQVVNAAADDSAIIVGLEAIIQDLGRNDAVAPGHSLGRLRDDVLAKRSGSPEQLAALHTLLLRAAGIPARLVVGYRLDATVDPIAVRPHAWAEFAVDGRGWVPSDPVPPSTLGADDSDDAAGATSTTTSTTLAPDAAVVEASVFPRELGPGETTDDPTTTSTPRSATVTVLVIAGALLAIVLSFILATAVARTLRRRRRRRSPTSEARAAGAWAEVLDRLRESGTHLPRSTSVADVVERVRELDPEAASFVAEMAPVVDEALYSEQPLDDDRSEYAWDLLRDTETALVASSGRRVIVRQYLDPRPLRRSDPVPAERPRTPASTGR